MPSSNPRYANHKAREEALAYVRRLAAEGVPCGICGKPIDMDAPQWFIDPKDGKRKRAPWSCECDEIIPMSAGGSPYQRINLQPAHRLCNQRKGGRRRTHQKIESHRGATSREW